MRRCVARFDDTTNLVPGLRPEDDIVAWIRDRLSELAGSFSGDVSENAMVQREDGSWLVDAAVTFDDFRDRLAHRVDVVLVTHTPVNGARPAADRDGSDGEVQ